MDERKKILIVDDNKDNIRVLLEVLKRDYKLNATTDGFKALDIAKSWEPDIVLLDVVMPGVSGYDVCMQLRECDETKHIPILFVSAVSDPNEEKSCLDVGALDYIKKPIDAELLKAKIKNFCVIKDERKLLSIMLENKRSEIDEFADELLYAAVSSAEFREKELGKWHIRRCLDYTKIFVKALLSNVHYEELITHNLAEAICKAVPYHDIGKTLLPEDIILKPDALTSEEFELMKTHVTLGADLIHSIAAEIDNEMYLKTVLDTIRYHHERWDGTGYPEGLKGTDIPLPARIMAIVDQYDTLISRRVYKEPIYHFEAVRIISSESGKGFDPLLIAEFLEVQDQFLEVMQKYMDKTESNETI